MRHTLAANKLCVGISYAMLRRLAAAVTNSTAKSSSLSNTAAPTSWLRLSKNSCMAFRNTCKAITASTSQHNNVASFLQALSSSVMALSICSRWLFMRCFDAFGRTADCLEGKLISAVHARLTVPRPVHWGGACHILFRLDYSKRLEQGKHQAHATMEAKACNAWRWELAFVFSSSVQSLCWSVKPNALHALMGPVL